MRKVHQDSDGTYGAPGITAELRDEGGSASTTSASPGSCGPSGSRESVCAAGTGPPSRTRLRRRHRICSDVTSPHPR
ncbi:transposase [Streptomyces sp. DK15]|uniref:transposase n=1 Tax=Streptomyces sp. DK15 TaxID=2957499 RepID=UPI0034DF8A7A